MNSRSQDTLVTVRSNLMVQISSLVFWIFKKIKSAYFVNCPIWIHRSPIYRLRQCRDIRTFENPWKRTRKNLFSGMQLYTHLCL